VIAIRGRYYDGRTSAASIAELQVHPDGMVQVVGPDGPRSLAFSALRIASRVGNTPRAIDLPDGARLETDDNDGVDAALTLMNRQHGARLLHRLESRLRYVALAVAVVLLCSWAAFQYGLPALAKHAAMALPVKTSTLIGRGALQIMDKSMFGPSELDAATQTRLRREFARIVAKQPGGVRYRLEFRHGNALGANAIALPSGTVVMTDELVRLSRDDRELIAVLAHEVGHVVHRHGLRRLIQDSIVALAALSITGDVSSTSKLIAALPTLLVEASYSQAFEREADAFALAYLRSARIDPVYFRDLLARLEAREHDGTGVARYLSSHPPTAERLRLLGGDGAAQAGGRDSRQ
jgi:Zn-dependent protease with chaperone function